MSLYKKLMLIIVGSITVMLAIPFIGIQVLRSDAGMAFIFLLFFAVDPIFVLWVGCVSGRDIKRLWFAPAIPSLAFLLSAWLLFEKGEPAFSLYAGIYLLLGVLAMLIRWMTARQKTV